MSDNYVEKYGEKLVDGGYRIIPIMPGTKRPGRWDGEKWGELSRWTEMNAQQVHVDLWSKWPGCGIGILTGEVVAIDIDILDESIAVAIGEVFQKKLGRTDLIRIGKSPKALYLYRTLEPFTKISLHPIEVLGQGQQFVAYATHPETGKPYSWPLESPHQMPVESLPIVTREQVMEAAEEAYKALPPSMRRTRLVTTVIPDKDAKTSYDGLVGTLAAVEDALKFIPNPDLSWDDWNRIGMAIYCATEAKGLHIFDQWSRASGKYNSSETTQRWEHYSKSPPSKIGAGTLYYHAQKNGWLPPPHLDLNPIKPVKIDLTGLKEPKRLPKSTKENFPNDWFTSPSLVGRVVRWINSTSQQPQPTFALMNTLCMFGAMFGRRYAMAHLNTRCNLFAIAVAKPGAGKDHSRQRVKELMAAAGLHQLICGDRFSSGVAILRTLFEFQSRISHLDEMGLYLQSLTAKNAASHQRDIIKTLLEVYSSSSGMYHGQEYADSTNRVRLDINQPNFNFFGTTTPRTLIPALNFDMVDNGTLSRILLVPPFEDYPDTQIPQMTSPPEDIVKDMMDSYNVVPAGVGNLTNMPSLPNSPVVPMIVHWEEAAFEEYKLVREWQVKQSRGDDALWVRYGEITVKLAMIEAIARDPISPTVTFEVFKMANDLARWSFNYTADLLVREVAENEIEASHKRVLNFIRKQGELGASSTQLAKSLQGMKARDRNEILQTLLESGDIVEDVIKKDGPGRDRRVYKIRGK
jgi:hypothetical protein